jgi:hypothetical protein
MRRAAAVILLVFAAQAYADPGHGMASLWHLLTEPDHLAIILLPLVIVVAVKWEQSPFRKHLASRTSGSRPPR